MRNTGNPRFLLRQIPDERRDYAPRNQRILGLDQAAPDRIPD